MRTIAIVLAVAINDVASLSIPSKSAMTKNIPTKVYIEDTDAYGVLYNANYLKYFDRAISSMFLKNSEQPIISEIHKQRFRSSPVLGENVIIKVEEIGGENIASWSRWNAVLTSEDGETVFNSAQLTLQFSDTLTISEELIQNISADSIISNDTFKIHRDEIDFDGKTSFVPLRSVMNFFERSRSNFLGGPNVLRKMQEVDGVIWVVTSVDQTCLFPKSCRIYPGDDLVVRTSFCFKRKSVLECCQTLLVNDERVAQSTITIWCLDNVTRRPKAAPQWCLDKVK